MTTAAVDQGEGAGGSSSSTASLGPSSEHRQRALLTKVTPGSVDDIVDFLGSAEGRRVYRFWASGSLTNARLLREYGAEVLEAFQATKLMSQD